MPSNPRAGNEGHGSNSASRPSRLATTRVASPLSESAQVDNARELVEDWLQTPEFSELLIGFGFSLTAPADSDSFLRTMLEEPVSWLRGDQIDPWILRLVQELPAEDPLRVTIIRLLLVEESADFCWNFRGGLPRAAIHLLRAVLAAKGHDLFTPINRTTLPFLIRESFGITEDHQIGLLGEFLEPEVVAGVVAVEQNDLIGLLAVLDKIDGAASVDPTVVRRHSQLTLEGIATYPQPQSQDYRERWASAPPPFSSRWTKLAHNAAESLGLVVATTPAGRSFDHSVVLGGGGRTPLLRAQYLTEMILEKGLQHGDIWMLGSSRLIDETTKNGHGATERGAADTYASGAIDEFDLMCAAAEIAFGAVNGAVNGDVHFSCGCLTDDSPCPEWVNTMTSLGKSEAALALADTRFQHSRIRTYSNSRFGVIRVLSAATSNLGARPNTADTYALLAKTAHFSVADQVLIVTTQVFVPFQTFDAIRMLTVPYGVDIEAVGFGAERSARPATPQYYLQEILSAIRSARRLMLDLVVRCTRPSGDF